MGAAATDPTIDKQVTVTCRKKGGLSVASCVSDHAIVEDIFATLSFVRVFGESLEVL